MSTNNSNCQSINIICDTANFQNCNLIVDKSTDKTPTIEVKSDNNHHNNPPVVNNNNATNKRSRKNSTDISVLGAEDKRQITAMTGCTASSNVLPLQLIYSGPEELQGAFPSALVVEKLKHNGFDIRQTPTHWSTDKTTFHYIDNIIYPYIIKTISNKCVRSNIVALL